MKDLTFVDNHSHLSDERIFHRASELIERAALAKVRPICLAGTEPVDWSRQLELKKRHPNLILNFGLHPWWVEKFSRREIDSVLEVLETMLPQASGVGETGLDFYSKRDASRFDDQRYAFRMQIRIAKRFNLPLVLHVVQAHEECVQILNDESIGDHPFVLHSYSGNATQVKEYLKFNAYISFSGTLVRAANGDGHEKTAKAFLATPVDRLLFETDSPDQGWDDQANEPSRVVEVYSAAAKLSSIQLEGLINPVSDNFRRLYS